MATLRLGCLLLLLSTAGCAGLGVAATAGAIGSVGSALDTGASVYANGKLDSAEMATRDHVDAAVRAAARELSLRIMSEKTRGDGKRRLQLVDQRHKVVDVWLDPRTPTLTRLRIDVGWFGNEPTARLILDRVRQHLPNTHTATRPAGEAAID